MNKQFGPWLLLPLLLLPRTATAQDKQAPPRGPSQHKQSHYFNNLRPLDDLASAQEMLPQRLHELHELHELHQLKDQVQELLKDPEFRKQIEKFSESDLRQLQEKMLAGKGLNQDLKWAQLLQQAASRQNWNPRQTDLLRRWAERMEHKPPSLHERILPNGPGPVAPTPQANAPGSPAPPSSLTPREELGPSLFDQLQEETKKWLMEEFDDMGDDMLQTFLEMDTRLHVERGNDRFVSLAELLRRVPQPDLSGINLKDHPLVPMLRSGTLSRYLSNVGDFLHRQSGVWDELSSFLRTAPHPSRPHFGGPSVSMPTSSASEGGGWAPALLSLMMLGTLVLLLYRSGFGPKSLGPSTDGEWRLGPWPVSPNAVSTRQDVIRAFEYLALLRLGLAAAACHHRQLAERLAARSHAERGNEGFDPARLQAAEMLACLYEQARYAPDGDAFSPEQLSDARQALCFFAGVTAS
jgi:hypothetical protein